MKEFIISLVSFLSVSFLAITIAWSDAPVQPPEKPWCISNPPTTKYTRVHELAGSKFHIVVASKQAEAKTQLSEVPFKRITREDATEMLRPGETVSPGSNLYLIRATALLVDSEYNVRSLFRVYVSLEDNAVQVLDFGLGGGCGRGTNLAIIVETEFDVQNVEVICASVA